MVNRASYNQSKQHHGFTLIELLVVVAIIAVLMAILLPSLGRARELSKRATCSVNLRGIALAYRMYADENSGYFCPVSWSNSYVFTTSDRSWTSAGGIDSNDLWKYDYFSSKKAFFCPSNTRYQELLDNDPWWGIRSREQTFWTTYFLTAGVGNNNAGTHAIDGRIVYDLVVSSSIPDGHYAPLTRLQYAGSTCAFTLDGNNVTASFESLDRQVIAVDMTSSALNPYESEVGPANHGEEGLNVSYVDGHVEWKRWTETKPSIGDWSNIARY